MRLMRIANLAELVLARCALFARACAIAVEVLTCLKATTIRTRNLSRVHKESKPSMTDYRYATHFLGPSARSQALVGHMQLGGRKFGISCEPSPADSRRRSLSETSQRSIPGERGLQTSHPSWGAPVPLSDKAL